MKETRIHPTAVIEEGAIIGQGVCIEPYVIVKSGVTIEDNVQIKAHCYIDGNTTIGEGSSLYPSVSVGTKTQDLKFGGETTYVRIGKNCEIREFTTINASCGEGSVVSVGDNCLIMACCHVAHQCTVGDIVVMANGVLLAGHVKVEDYAIIGGMTAVHQFTQVGCHAMVGGMTRVSHDVLPYSTIAGIPAKLGGLNLVGLKRRGFNMHVRSALSRAYRLIYRSGLGLAEAIERIEAEIEALPEVKHILDFCRASKRGLICQEGVKRSRTDEKGERDKELLEVT
ncbi:MAG: acyl-ACP--UDP-N-acetylglucosamine O-acyltransferase [Chlamydiia bacterium]|nr:acyl-ACP--UDP-N-acetylglucosamine O-acyltransferase [Chlamydiia bacterium]